MQRLPSSSDHAWWDRFQSLLDDQIDWPSPYLFKFIVPRAEVDALRALFGEEQMQMRHSRKGNYVSVTARMIMQSSDDVIAVYKAAARVEGVISL
ncbi:DUF493 domain-containing protein [Rhodothermaceae bacterium RA]|nr:DUF493 domain-containing protein [Rhodothermaceae bacterium RA]